MKFGRNLPRNQVPEWASAYIKYKTLKKLIKSAAGGNDRKNPPDIADRNLEDVDDFYTRKYGDATRRLKLLQDRYGRAIQAPQSMDGDEIEDLISALLELRGQLRKLQWYGEVNRRGFIKITKKLDKKLTHSSTQRRYLESKVDIKGFATNSSLQGTMKSVHEWLSTLSEIKTHDDSSSTHSIHSIQRASSKFVNDLPVRLLETLDLAIRYDRVPKMLDAMNEATAEQGDSSDELYQVLALNVLQRAITYRAKECIDKLLDKIATLEENDDINKRNCIHRLIVTMSRSCSADEESSTEMSPNLMQDQASYITPAAPPVLLPLLSRTKEYDGATKLGRDDQSVILLRFLLERLRPKQRVAIQAMDAYGRIPLHYAAQYGFVAVCQILVSYMQAWGLFEMADGIDAPFWLDNESRSPLHLSAIGGHPLTAKVLLEAEEWRASDDRRAAVHKHMSRSGEVLALAVKSNFVLIVRLLVEAGVDKDYQDDQGETALHIAARFGYSDCAKALLDNYSIKEASTELAESAFGWTPIFVACVDGHLSVVELFIEAGANLERLDSSGWTAKEHAALRGHMDIARALARSIAVPVRPDIEALPNISASRAPNVYSLGERRSNGLVNGSGNIAVTEPVKTFGHRYLTQETMILVSIGTMDMRKSTEAVNLHRIPLASAHSTQLDTALSMVVSATGAKGEPFIFDLPVQDSVSTEPIVFTTSDATNVKLLFDIVPTYAGSKDKVVGRGVALLSSIKPSLGSKRISLQGDVTVPVIAANTLEVIGSVKFNFLIITPFAHPNMIIAENHTYWKSVTSTMVIGHRGLGKNVASRKSLQLGENTIQSFIAAANLGAQYVEFDVQLTKDLVPVIYHDFLVSETGIDAPVHTLTLEQFLHVNGGRTSRSSRPPSPVLYDKNLQKFESQDNKRHRSMSVDLAADNTSDMRERMKHTRDFKQKGFKGNSRGNSIQAPFTTLEEMFKTLDEHLGFNIEMKYPMLHESEEQEMDTYAVELNSFVDTVLTKVYDLAKKRPVIFSSFNPDICLLLSFKQPSIPILFLTDAGTYPVSDVRASSLQEAIRFASRWNLLGVVTAAEPLVLCPRLVKVVKESGLVCVSYGTMNNDEEKVNLQVKEGIDAVIVDNVLAIRKGLTGSKSEADAGSRLRPETERRETTM
ncbi:MAG: hypothetical protein Q9214_001102 [Letrouitia sp. 1 TL-2023]